MKLSKKRTKNKQELSPASGAKTKPQYKIKVKFTFQTAEGEILQNGKARLKIMQDGGVSCLVQNEEGWIAVKGKLISIKLYAEKPKLLGDPKKRKSRVPRKSS